MLSVLHSLCSLVGYSALQNEVPALARSSSTAVITLAKLCSLHSCFDGITCIRMKSALFTTINFRSMLAQDINVGCQYSYSHPAEINTPF